MILDQILARTKERLQLRMSLKSQGDLEKLARNTKPPKSFIQAIKRPENSPLKIVAEFMRAAPLRGILNPKIKISQFAAACVDGGACAMSVYTEEEHFKGSLKDLAAMRNASTVPVLHRDFIIDRYQLYESRATGADAVVLNLPLLEREKLREFLTILKDLSMEGIVEVGEERELGTALAAGAACLRIDNRDPRSLRNVPGKAQRLYAIIPPDMPVLVEPEHGNMRDYQQWDHTAADALILSEPLVISPNPTLKIRELRGNA